MQIRAGCGDAPIRVASLPGPIPAARFRCQGLSNPARCRDCVARRTVAAKGAAGRRTASEMVRAAGLVLDLTPRPEAASERKARNEAMPVGAG